MSGSWLLTELLEVASSGAQAAGALIRDQRPASVTVADTKTSPTDVVTEMDRRSEELLLGHLLSTRPSDGILGEEGSSRPSSSGITWVVDPIDGTVNYLYGLPGYSVSVAAVTGDPTVPGGYQVQVGVVYDPILRDLYTAMRGEGALRNGGRLRCGPGPDLASALVGTGFGYEQERRTRQAKLAAYVLPQIRDLRRFGSAALDLCHVAAGRLDAYYEQGLNPWDLAAGELIAREAGAIVTGWAGAPAGPQWVLAAGPKLHGQLAELLGGYPGPVLE